MKFLVQTPGYWHAYIINLALKRRVQFPMKLSLQLEVYSIVLLRLDFVSNDIYESYAKDVIYKKNT